MSTPRLGTKWIYKPTWFDKGSGPESLTGGETVTITQPHGCPKNGTMGMVYVNGPDGKFAGQVCIASLTKEGTA